MIHALLTALVWWFDLSLLFGIGWSAFPFPQPEEDQ